MAAPATALSLLHLDAARAPRGEDAMLRGGYGPLAEALADRLVAGPASARLVLAGEHTDPTDPATVHGAWRSGLRAASALIDALDG